MPAQSKGDSWVERLPCSKGVSRGSAILRYRCLVDHLMLTGQLPQQRNLDHHLLVMPANKHLRHKSVIAMHTQ